MSDVDRGDVVNPLTLIKWFVLEEGEYSHVFLEPFNWFVDVVRWAWFCGANVQPKAL